MSSSSNAGAAVAASPDVKPVESCAEEDEEVLVDDFDGECCRTYAYNHSRIVRWQKEKEERKKAAQHHQGSKKNGGAPSSSSASKGHSARKSPSGKISSSASGHSSAKTTGGATSGSTGKL